MEMIKPIETQYNGYRFRSRLEARWAVFFDTLKIEYQYEPEGFNLDGLWYLPDFFLPSIRFSKQEGIWIEIKPKFPNSDEREKAARLALFSGCSVFITVDSFDKSWPRLLGFFPNENKYYVNQYYIGSCPDCKAVTFAQVFHTKQMKEHNIEPPLLVLCFCGYLNFIDTKTAYAYLMNESILIAYQKARGARF
jgi:hypothetical protein